LATISLANYEVGADLRARFDAADDRFFTASNRPNHYHFDLPGCARTRLERAGLRQISDLGLCTYPPDNGFFSYRRTTHLGEADYGREISAIVRAFPDR
jgi:copper oxidase (laccase) domain-containing protein